jgi:hypothetical protein
MDWVTAPQAHPKVMLQASQVAFAAPDIRTDGDGDDDEDEGKHKKMQR